MGYVRMVHGNTTLLVDTGPQVLKKKGSFSPLGFEMSTGRQHLIVNAGPGILFGDEWCDISRSAKAHSGVSVVDFTPDMKPAKKKTAITPRIERSKNAEFEMIAASHDGYLSSHGLRHYRSLEMAQDGSFLRGKDILVAEGQADKSVYREWLDKNKKKLIRFEARFHLHPDITPEVGLNDTAVTLTTPKGDLWVLRTDGTKIVLKEGAYMEYGRLRPRATKQVVVTGRAIDYEGAIEWSLIRLES